MQNFIQLCKKNVLFFSILLLFSRPLFSSEVKTSVIGNNLINIQTGNVFSIFSNIQIKDKAGLSFSVGTLNSSIKDCSFNSYLISSSFFFPIKNITIQNNLDIFVIDNLFFSENINFNQLLVPIGTINGQIDFNSFSIGTSFSAGTITTNSAKFYVYKLSPNIPFLSFSINIKSLLGKFLFQYGMLDININSNQQTIESSGFQNNFLFLYQNKILFDKTNLSFWGGGLYTQGNAFAKTNSVFTNLNIYASDNFLILGTGIRFNIDGTLFYLKSNLDFIYLLISNAKSDLNMKILGIHNNYNFIFEEYFNYALIIPSIETGIKLKKGGKFFVKKNLPIPISFKKKSDSQLDSSATLNYSFLNILLSGLTIGIEL